MTQIRFIFDDGSLLLAALDTTKVAQDLAALLPLDLTLMDYNRTEKVAPLPRRLNTSEAPGSYRASAGDITFYAPMGTLALFYKPFQTAHGLVRLGAFEGPIDALTKQGNIPVRIERTT